MANGGREQLFDLEHDHLELQNLATTRRETADLLRAKVLEQCDKAPDLQCMVQDGALVAYPFEARELTRLHQFDFSRGVSNFTMPSQKKFISDAHPN
jgi:choline-sulfatase